MTGPVYKPYASNKKALAFANQSVSGTGIALTTADLLDCASITWRPNAITSQDPRYTGTTKRRGPIMLGVTYDITFEWTVHGPGNAVPAADAWVPGRVLKQLGFTENRVTTAVGPEGFTGGTTSQVTLGAAAVGTTDLYKGLVINLATVGAAPLGFGMIRSYTSGKVATLARLRATAATGNYTIPQQLAYTYSGTDPVAGASITIWEDGDRLNFIDMVPSGDQTVQLFTSSRDGTEYCRIACSFTGILYSQVAEATPAVDISIAVPPFRNGQDDFANIQMGGASATLTLSKEVAYPPNANQETGNDPPMPTGDTRTLTIERNRVSLATVDFKALSDAQGYHAYQALWGLGAGNYMGFMVANGRIAPRSVNSGNAFDTTSGELWIDDVDKCVSLVFPIGY